MFEDNTLVRAQQSLEENEDLIASVVETLQLERLDDSLAQYLVLHKNLVSMAMALDNYPADDTDPYEACHIFPDEIMRKDILDELKPADFTVVPKAPLPPPCQKCALLKFSSEKCRCDLDHVDLNSKFSDSERVEFVRVTQVLEVRHRQRKPDGSKSRSAKRAYRRWTPHERYTVSVGIALFGEKGYRAMASVLCDRSIEQIRSFIIKAFTTEEREALVSGAFPRAPEDYDPPRSLLSNHLFLKTNPQYIGLAAERCAAPSLLTPKQGFWTSLLGIANGITVSSGNPLTASDGNDATELSSSPSALIEMDTLQAIASLSNYSNNKVTYQKTIPKIKTITLSDIPDMLYSLTSSTGTSSTTLRGSVATNDERPYSSPSLLTGSLTNTSERPFSVEDTLHVCTLPSCPKPALVFAMPAPKSLTDALAKPGSSSSAVTAVNHQSAVNTTAEVDGPVKGTKKHLKRARKSSPELELDSSGVCAGSVTGSVTGTATAVPGAGVGAAVGDVDQLVGTGEDLQGPTKRVKAAKLVRPKTSKTPKPKATGAKIGRPKRKKESDLSCSDSMVYTHDICSHEYEPAEAEGVGDVDIDGWERRVFAEPPERNSAIIIYDEASGGSAHTYVASEAYREPEYVGELMQEDSRMQGSLYAGVAETPSESSILVNDDFSLMFRPTPYSPI